MTSNSIIEAKYITKYFHDPVSVKVLKEINLSIEKGEFVSITGKSGCGKSTLLYILSTLDTDFEGQLFIDGVQMKDRTEDQLSRVRNQKIGFIFQFHYLLNEFNVIKNVMLPGEKLGQMSLNEIENNAYEKLKILGIEDQALKKPNQLSGGQKQRVAIARALINDPLIIMGDEPTGNLDNKNTDIIFELLHELTDVYRQTMLIVTHDLGFASKTNRIIEMEDGMIVSDK